jgi:hypothetical protein
MQQRVLISGALLLTHLSFGADLAALPANTWTPIKPVIDQPAKADEKGQWINVGWNKLVYDAAGKRILFYDRWDDKKHGGYTIYGNCLFSFEPATARLKPVKISNWYKDDLGQGSYRTKMLPENDSEPTPCDRHVYYAFEYIPDSKSVFLCNGANLTVVLNGQFQSNHNTTANTWRYDLEKASWAKINSKQHPSNDLADGMAYCPDTKSIVYEGHGSIWIFDLASEQWRKSKQMLAGYPAETTVFYDPPRRRMLLVGGGAYLKMDDKSAGFNKLYSFDPVTEKLGNLADCPAPQCRGALAYDSKRDLFFSAVNFDSKSGAQPSGLFCYDPKKDAWSEVQCSNELPIKKAEVNAWMPMCYDSTDDCLVGMTGDSFYAFRYVVPAK